MYTTCDVQSSELSLAVRIFQGRIVHLKQNTVEPPFWPVFCVATDTTWDIRNCYIEHPL